MNDTQALRDQLQAQQRDYADWCLNVFDIYLKAGHVTTRCPDDCSCMAFTRNEAMELLHRYLDLVECHAAP